MNNYYTWARADRSFWIGAICPDLLPDIVDLTYKFLDETPTRVPFSDWYTVHSGVAVDFYGQKTYRARGVVGGVFSPVLLSKVMKERERE